MERVDQRQDHVLPDGTTVRIRPIRSDDRDRLLAMWARTSAESRRLRFLGPFNLDESNVGRFTDLNPATQYALVATRGRDDAESIVGIAQFEQDPDVPGQAEFAALVEDAHQGRGIGTALVRELAKEAADQGVTHLTGDILADNVRMLNLVRELGLEYRSDREGGVVRSDLEVAITDRFLDVVEDTEREAAEAALRRFFRPEKVAIVGASRDATSIGAMVFRHLIQGGFSGVVYPVNPQAPYVQGVAAYPTLSACPEVPDLVVVCVPAPAVNDVVDEAGELGVRAVCVISAGFAEIGGKGEELQDDLLVRARSHGLRVIGPNCMGLLNGSPDVRMNATFSTVLPRPGRVSMSSQSGALGLAVIRHVEEIGLGISTFVSVGNKADISGNDLVMYWERDPDTDVILMYLESFGNPRKFSRIARRVSLQKPIVAVKSGRTTAGVRAASSHTAAMAAGETAVEALFRQTGVIRTDTLEEMFDVATLLASQRLPRGNKVAVITNAGGPGILAADALESHGLEVPRFSDRTVAELRSFLPMEAGVTNPVDMIASATPESFARTLETVAKADEIDIVLVSFVPAAAVTTEMVARALIEAKPDVPEDVPVAAVFMSPTEDTSAELAAAGITLFEFPEPAARALGRVATYARWRRRPLGDVVEPADIDRDRARSVVARVLDGVGDEGSWVSSADTAEILDAYRVPLARARVVTTPEQGAEAQREIGVPVAVKVAAPIHKVDVGGLELGIDTPEGVAAAIERIRDALTRADLAHHSEEFLVQEMVGEGVEMVVGVTHDPSFGPIIATGMGGTLVELLRDVSVRITPLTDQDVDDMLSELKMAPLLTGYRGSKPADVEALKDLLFRINAMVEDLPEVTELDLNPVFVQPEGKGVVAVDVRLRLTPTR